MEIIDYSVISDFEMREIAPGEWELTKFTGDLVQIARVQVLWGGEKVLVAEIEIPAQIRGRKVVSLGSDLFKGNEYIFSVKINEGIKTIQEAAFRGCKNLSSVVLPNTLKTIAKHAFDYTNLRDIFIPKSVKKIGECAFGFKENPPAKVIFDGNCDIDIDDGAFHVTNGVTLYLSCSIKNKIGKWIQKQVGWKCIDRGETIYKKDEHGNILYDCKGNPHIVYKRDPVYVATYDNFLPLDPNITMFAEAESQVMRWAKENRRSVSEYTVAEKRAHQQHRERILEYNLPSVFDKKAMEEEPKAPNRRVAKELAMKTGIMTSWCFTYEDFEKSIYIIPEYVKKIPKGAFSSYEKLKTLTFDTDHDNKLEVIGEGAFSVSNCRAKLSEVYLPKTLKRIEKFAFLRQPIKTLQFEDGCQLESIGQSAFSCFGASAFVLSHGELILPERLKHIGDGAFSANPYFKRIDISKCNLLEVISVRAFSEASVSEIVMPSEHSVTAIEERAFEGTKIREFDFTGISSIGAYAFAKTKLKKVVLPEGCKVDTTAFDQGVEIRYSSELVIQRPAVASKTQEKQTPKEEAAPQKDEKNVAAPVKKAPSEETSALQAKPETVAVKKPAPTPPSAASSLTSEQPKAKEDPFAEFTWENRSQGRVLLGAKDKSATTVTVPEGVAIIGAKAFADMASLSVLILPASLKEIKSEAFSGCSALKQVTIPPSVITVGNKAFFNCKALAKVYFRGDLKTVGNEAFANCAMQSVSLPSDVELVGTGAFSGNPMRSAKLPEGAEIKANAFPEACRIIEE